MAYSPNREVLPTDDASNMTVKVYIRYDKRIPKNTPSVCFPPNGETIDLLTNEAFHS